MKHLPNLLTLANLFCGTVAVIFAVQENYINTGLFVILGIIFDFFDGFAARLLKVSGELGKQLDSLADMVTSGVVPGIIMVNLLGNSFTNTSNSFLQEYTLSISLIGLLLTLGSCLRLAKFNLDERQSNSFIGLPTPAMSLFVISLPLIQQYTDIEIIKDLVESSYFLIVTTLVLTYLMNAEILLFSLKFKTFGFKENFIKYLFLLMSIVIIILIPLLSIPIIIILYVVISILKK